MIKRPKFSKIIVATIILINIVFTAAILYIFFRIGDEPTSLIVAWFAFTTGELWMLSGIKKTEAKRGSKDDNSRQI